MISVTCKHIFQKLQSAWWLVRREADSVWSVTVSAVTVSVSQSVGVRSWARPHRPQLYRHEITRQNINMKKQPKSSSQQLE